MVKQDYTEKQLVIRIGASIALFKKIIDNQIIQIQHKTVRGERVFSLTPLEVRELARQYENKTEVYGRKRMLKREYA